MRVTSRPGSKLTGFSPNIPNPEFFPHAMLLLTFIAINLDLPVQVLLLDAKQTNFSGWRGAMDQARLRFRDIQRWFASWFHNEVYAWKLRQRAAEEPAVRSVVARLGAAAFLNRWNFPRWPYIEPMTDAAADLLRQRNLLAAPRMVAAERGYDFDDIYRQTIDDNAAVIRAAKAKAKELNAEDSGEVPIDWRELLALPTPDRVSLNVSQSTTLTETTTPTQGV
jgi:capsid protein